MESQFTQLRFDISEMVRLHPQQPGIDALLELDLYPDVEIKDEGQHLKIEGYLRLNGVYVGAEKTDLNEEVPLHTRLREERTNELAYVIPVEITLPADRAERSRISAEVETFDYEVLSPFELKIEAILMIDGLLPELNEEEEQAEETEPKYPVFSGSNVQPLTISRDYFQDQSENQSRDQTTDHPKEDCAAYLQPFGEQLEKQDVENEIQPEQKKELYPETEEETDCPQAKEEEASSLQKTEDQHEKTVQPEVNIEIKPSPQDFWRDRQQSKVCLEEVAETPTAEKEKRGAGPDLFKEEAKAEEKQNPYMEEAKTEEKQNPHMEEAKTEEKQNPHMEEAKAEEMQDSHMKEEAKTDDETQDEATEIDPETETCEEMESEEGTEWIRWLVKGKEENFVPIRMVIVQENETIDHVANKYEVSADWLVKVNRLQTDRLEPGQILQVPEKKNRDDEDREAHFQ